jgi:hypothetical protein
MYFLLTNKRRIKMKDLFEKPAKLELFKLEYSEQHAQKLGYHTGEVNGEIVKYTNVSSLLINGDSVFPESGYAWPDKKTVVDVCVGYPKNHQRYRTSEGQQIDRFASHSLAVRSRRLFDFRDFR